MEKSKDKEITNKNKKTIIFNILLIFLISLVLLVLNFVLDNFVHLKTIDGNITTVIVFAIALISICKYYIKNFKSLNILSKASIILIISGSISTLVYRYVLGINKSITASEFLIFLSYLLFIGNFTHFTYSEYVKKGKDALPRKRK